MRCSLRCRDLPDPKLGCRRRIRLAICDTMSPDKNPSQMFSGTKSKSKTQCVEAFVMIFKTGTSLVFLAASLTALAALPANAATSSAAARQNVIQSERYDRLLETNRSFRQARMRRECGPITDPQLRQSCLNSFAQNEPAAGHATSSKRVASSKPARHTTHSVGSSKAPRQHPSPAGQ